MMPEKNPFSICHEAMQQSSLSTAIRWLRKHAATHPDREQMEKLLRQHFEKVANASHTDALTGLPNRTSLTHSLHTAIGITKRHNVTQVLVMLDLDGFKTLNDDHGHAAGDRLLCSFTKVVQKYIRTSDLFGRYGGDEFILLLRHTQLAEGRLIIKRLQQHLDPPLSFCAGLLEINRFSVTYPLEEMIAKADKALYEAKSRGENRLSANRLL